MGTIVKETNSFNAIMQLINLNYPWKMEPNREGFLQSCIFYLNMLFKEINCG